MAAVSFAVWRFFNRLLTKLKDGTISQAHISVSSKVDELFMMIQWFKVICYVALLYDLCSNCIPTVGVVVGILSLLIFIPDQAPSLVVY